METFPPHKRISLTPKAFPPPSQIVTFSSSCHFWLRVFLIYRHLIAASASSVFLRLAFSAGTFIPPLPDRAPVLSMLSSMSNTEEAGNGVGKPGREDSAIFRPLTGCSKLSIAGFTACCENLRHPCYMNKCRRLVPGTLLHPFTIRVIRW